MRCFGVQHRCIFLLVLCIFTRPASSSKCYRTRKNIQRYCTPKHLIRYIYDHSYDNMHGGKYTRKENKMKFILRQANLSL